jgi:hypothetical protein
MKSYFCYYEGNYNDDFTGHGDTPKAAYNEVCAMAGDDNVNPLDCTFYEAKEVDVSVETKIEVMD